MPIVVEGTYTSTDERSSWSSIPNVVIPASSDRVLYVFLTHKQNTTAGGKFAVSVRWDSGGANEWLTRIGLVEQAKSVCEIWRFVAPTAKTADVLIAWGDDHANRSGSVHAAVITSGVHQVTPDINVNTSKGSGSSSSLSITTVPGHLCYGAVETVVAITENGEGTEQWNRNSSGASRGAGVSFVAVDTQTDFAFSFSSGNTWSMAGLSIVPVPIIGRESRSLARIVQQFTRISRSLARDVVSTARQSRSLARTVKIFYAHLSKAISRRVTRDAVGNISAATSKVNAVSATITRDYKG